MSVVFDEYGRPFIIMREQQRRERLKGLDAQKANIMAAKTVANILKSSLGPKGMDKMLVSPDGDVTITNDGATILDRMDVQHQIGRLMVQLSQSQDAEIGDGTTGVVVLAGALLAQAEKLLSKGLHAVKISEGFELACELCLAHLNEISSELMTNVDMSVLQKTAETTLSSKIVSKYKTKLAEVATKAVLQVADLDRRDVNFELITVTGKVGGSLEDTQLLNGIVLDKDFSHPQMPKAVSGEKDGVKVCILTCAFEPPKPKTKHKLNISSAEEYRTLQEEEQKYFIDMVDQVKNAGVDVAFCQWGFDDEANHLLYHSKLNAVRWVGGVEIELLALATGARIVPRFSELTSDKLGKAKSVKEISLNTSNDSCIVVETDPKVSKSVTVLVRGSNEMVVAEAKRSLHDAMCVVRNLIRDNRIVYGGGSAEISLSLHLDRQITQSTKSADSMSHNEEYAVRGFSEALTEVALVLAENSGFKPLQTVSKIKMQQNETGNHCLGVDCMAASGSDIADMKELGVFETLIGKAQQIQLATQMVKMVLKIDDVISPADN